MIKNIADEEGSAIIIMKTSYCQNNYHIIVIMINTSYHIIIIIINTYHIIIIIIIIIIINTYHIIIIVINTLYCHMKNIGAPRIVCWLTPSIAFKWTSNLFNRLNIIKSQSINNDAGYQFSTADKQVTIMLVRTVLK